MMEFIDELGQQEKDRKRDSIHFQGVKFNLDAAVHDTAFCPNMPDSMKLLVAFLRELDEENQSNRILKGGLIAYADDQFIN